MNLYNHQQELLKINPDKYLMAWGTGTGKTFGVLSLVANKGIKSVLIISPKSIVEKWREDVTKIKNDGCEFEFHSKENFRKFHRVLPRVDCLILDEAHYCFGRSQINKSVMWYIKKHQPKYIYALTATPYMSTPWNVYQAMMILGKKDYGYMRFDNEFFTRVRMGNRWIPMVRDWDEIKDKLVDLIHSMGGTIKLQDCVDMPDDIIQKEYFELTADQKRAIREIDEPLPIQRWNKIHQICGGTVKRIEGNSTYKCDKMQRLYDACKENKKLVIVAAYTAEIKAIENMILESFPDRPLYAFTGENSNNRITMARQADTDENSIVIINAACSEGYELSSFELMIFYSQNFSLKDAEQMKGRIRRINNIHRWVYRYYIIKDTIDEDVFKSYERKEEFQVALYARDH